MKHEWRNSKPMWSWLYVIGLVHAGLVGLIEAAVPPGAARTILLSIVVIAAFGMMMVWRRLNRTRLDLTRRSA